MADPDLQISGRGGRHPDSGGRAHRSPPLDAPLPLGQTKLFSEVSIGSIY